MNPKKKIVLISLISGIVISILVFLGLSFLLNKIEINSKKLQDITEKLTAIQTKSSNIKDIEKKYNKILPDLEKAKRFFVDLSAPIEIIKRWEEMARGLNLSISISPLSSSLAEEKKEWSFSAFRINLTGSSDAFFRFLEKLENDYYFIQIEKIIARKLTNEELRSEKYSKFSPNDITGILEIKVFSK